MSNARHDLIYIAIVVTFFILLMLPLLGVSPCKTVLPS